MHGAADDAHGDCDEPLAGHDRTHHSNGYEGSSKSVFDENESNIHSLLFPLVPGKQNSFRNVSLFY